MTSKPPLPPPSPAPQPAAPARVVAIDGPAGAGKSTVARALADRLGYVLLDSGALYRAVALAAQRARVDWSNEAAVAAIAADLVGRDALRLEPVAAAASSAPAVRVLLGDEDVSLAIRTQDISRGASQISQLPTVRAALLELQRQLGRRGGVIAEGRDMGTVVFPDAPVKIFLTASAAIRGARRFEELRARGQDVSEEQICREVEQRDQADCSRAVAPLRQAEDAVLVDSSHRTVDDVVAELVELVGRRIGG